jgi:PhnB protein
MKLRPYITLHFDGRCEAAFRFYERRLGAKIVFLLAWGDSPFATEVAPDFARKILYGRITVGDRDISGGDVPPEQYERPKGFSIMLTVPHPADAERIFQALAEDGMVRLPLQQTFWSPRYGALIDQFGIPWEINCEER